MIRYFLYARKSTDDEERQILSIDAQLTELREFARKENIVIVEEFIESKTAKVPGRPVFNSMMECIQLGEAQGLLAWHPDRLARNSVDGGLIIYLLDTDHLKALKFPTFWFENTPQGKFMLNIAFGQSKYYVDNLRENVLRGIRQKLRRGEFPGKPPIGYLNEPRLRNIVIDEAKAPLVTKMFEEFATGEHTFASIRALTILWGLHTFNNKPIALSQIPEILANPFYIGLMRYDGELYEASHSPLISKELFDQVQILLQERSRPRQKTQTPFPFVGLLRCAECGCSITAEQQKGHHYYRCTKRRKPCSQPFIREELLAEQLRAIVAKAALPESWVKPIRNQLATWHSEATQADETAKLTLEAGLADLEAKLTRLTDLYLAGELSREEYLPRKEKWLNDKAELKAKLANAAVNGNSWLEPTKQFFEASIDAVSVASNGDLAEIATFLKTTGSNLTLFARKACAHWQKPWSLVAHRPSNSDWWS